MAAYGGVTRVLPGRCNNLSSPVGLAGCVMGGDDGGRRGRGPFREIYELGGPVGGGRKRYGRFVENGCDMGHSRDMH